MPELAVYDSSGRELGEKMPLPEAIFAHSYDRQAVYQAVVAYQAHRAHDAASTLTRMEVSGGGRKPWRQKGTGRARQGSIRAPHWVGGGVVFGPHPGARPVRLPKKVKRAALCSVLTEKLQAGDILAVRELSFDAPKTRRMGEALAALGLEGEKVLLILGGADETVYKSARNIPGVEVRVSPAFSTYDLLWANKVVLVGAAVDRMAEVWAS